MVKKSNSNRYIYSIGRRKSAIAAAKLFSTKGESQVNGISVEKYFPGEILKKIYNQPFTVTGIEGKFHFQAKINGGGKMSQVEALALAVSRCLKKLDEETYLPSLRSVNLLSVDSRVRQRRMVGTGGKSRRQKQSPKR